MTAFTVYRYPLWRRTILTNSFSNKKSYLSEFHPGECVSSPLTLCLHTAGWYTLSTAVSFHLSVYWALKWMKKNFYLLLFVCKCPDRTTAHQRAVLIANRWFTLRNMKRRVFVLQSGARAFLAAFLPLASHRMNDASDNTHLQVQRRTYSKSNSTGGRIEFRVWTLTLSGWQRTSVHPQSLVKEDVTNPVGQLRVEFLQLHVHSSSSQHFVFFTVGWRCDGHSIGAWSTHSSFLHTEAGKKYVRIYYACSVYYAWVCSTEGSQTWERTSAYHTRRQAGTRRGSSAPQFDRLYSAVLRVGHSS